MVLPGRDGDATTEKCATETEEETMLRKVHIDHAIQRRHFTVSSAASQHLHTSPSIHQ